MASLCHYIGRLGCWFGKCENLVLTACQFPELLENARCEFLALPNEIRPPVNRAKVYRASALKRMLPADQQGLVQTLHDQLAGMRLFDIPLVFSDDVSSESLMGRVHAEVFLIGHFYFNRFRFGAVRITLGVANLLAIAAVFTSGSTRETLFCGQHTITSTSTWIPLLVSQLDEAPKRKHNLDIMNQMNAYMRRDIKEEIEEEMPRGEKAPDSTSGVDLYSFLSQ